MLIYSMLIYSMLSCLTIRVKLDLSTQLYTAMLSSDPHSCAIRLFVSYWFGKIPKLAHKSWPNGAVMHPTDFHFTHDDFVGFYAMSVMFPTNRSCVNTPLQ